MDPLDPDVQQQLERGRAATQENHAGLTSKRRASQASRRGGP